MNEIERQPTDLNISVARLSKDLKAASKTLSRQEARYLVDYYYLTQEDRKRASNQVRAMGEADEPCAVVGWLASQAETLEGQIKRALDAYTDAHPIGAWLKEIVGIGPVIAAGLLCHIDIEKAPTVGHIWRFAGLDPTMKWEKGQKRPFNASLKTLCWKAGQSFMKFSGRDDCVYGKLYKSYKVRIIQLNQEGAYREQALERAGKVGKDTDAYKAYSIGQLPPAHIDARARRYAVKQFLSDLHGFWYREHFGKEPPLPYPIAILGHAHYRQPGTAQYHD